MKFALLWQDVTCFHRCPCLDDCSPNEFVSVGKVVATAGWRQGPFAAKGPGDSTHTVLCLVFPKKDEKVKKVRLAIGESLFHGKHLLHSHYSVYIEVFRRARSLFTGALICIFGRMGVWNTFLWLSTDRVTRWCARQSRNIANLVNNVDTSAMSVIQYAVGILQAAGLILLTKRIAKTWEVPSKPTKP